MERRSRKSSTTTLNVLALVAAFGLLSYGGLSIHAAVDPVLGVIGSQTTNEGDTLALNLSATDADLGDALTFTVQNAPDGAVFVDNGDRTATFTWTPNTEQSGVYRDILFTVSDGTASDFEKIMTTVHDGRSDCVPSWACTAWTTCTDSLQYRSCDDALLCGIDTGKPNESQTCDSTAPLGVTDLGTSGSCPGCTPPPVCGDLVCSTAESCSVCAQDCGTCPVTNVTARFGSEGGLEQFSDEEVEAGVEISREIINWSTIEPGQDSYFWDDMDTVVQMANVNDIEVVGHFIFTPTWAEVDPVGCTSNICAITDMDEFRQFAHDVAERYDGGHGHGTMRYIEILNEVTSGQFFDLHNTEYEDWLIAGYEGVKAGNANAQVLIGGFVNPLDVKLFVEEMLDLYDQYYDIISYHVYVTDATVNEATVWLKEAMERYGVDRPLWLTETATMVAPTNPDWRKLIAQGVIKRLTSAFGNGVERAFWWMILGGSAPEESAQYGDPTEKVIGLGWVYPKGIGLPNDFHPRQMFNTYRMMAAKLKGFRSVEKLTETHYRFVVNTRIVYVLWCDSGSCPLPDDITGPVSVTDYLGNTQTVDASTIVLDSDPIFVE